MYEKYTLKLRLLCTRLKCAYLEIGLFLATFFCAASEEKSFCMQSHTLVDPCVKNCYPKEIIIILHVVLHGSVHTM